VFVPGKTYQPSLMFAGKTGDYLSDAPLYDRLLTLPTNIRLGWRGGPETNAPAYYENSKITDVKFFITMH
jgi:hypothetical protein